MLILMHFFKTSFCCVRSALFMRVRKINQIDVKLHDLTKVKLKDAG